MNGLEVRRLTPKAILWILLLVVIVLYGFPFVYLVLTSFKTPSDAIAVPPAVLARAWTLENYVTALAKEGVVPALLNSVITAVLSTGDVARARDPGCLRHHPVPHPVGPGLRHRLLVTRMVPTIAIGARPPVITGEFRKNVPRYLKDKQYAEGWSDGFRQCQAMRKAKTAKTIAAIIGTNVKRPGNNRKIRRPCVSLAMSRCQTSTEKLKA